jgi:hypothetical protein
MVIVVLQDVVGTGVLLVPVRGIRRQVRHEAQFERGRGGTGDDVDHWRFAPLRLERNPTKFLATGVSGTVERGADPIPGARKLESFPPPSPIEIHEP